MARITHRHEAREALAKGVRAITDVIKLTLGPAGRNVVISYSLGGLQIVNDGLTITRDIELPNRAENMGAQLIREVCHQTHEKVGDGTTTAAVLAAAMIAEALRNVATGVNPVRLRAAIMEAAEIGIQCLKRLAKPAHDYTTILRIATLSAGNDETIGQTVADALEVVGKEGLVTVEESKSVTTRFEHVPGMRLNCGFVSPYLVTDTELLQAVLDDAYVLCLDQSLSDITELIPLLEKLAQIQRPLLVFAHEIVGEALSTLVLNQVSKVLNCCAVKVRRYAEETRATLEDIAALTNSHLITAEQGISLANVSSQHLGRVKRARITRDSTTLIADPTRKAALDRRIARLKQDLEHTTSDSDRRKLRMRIGQLADGIGVIKVGAYTEMELTDRKLRFDNALNAALSAMDEGYLPGGGTALIRASQAVSEAMALHEAGERRTGYDIVRKSFEQPLSQIASNAGYPGKVVVHKVRELDTWIGFDALSLQYVNMETAGIIDSAKVLRTAIQTAASVAALVLTTDSIVTIS